MKVLITGVAGFIGSHLAERIIKSGTHVIGIDNFDPFYSKKEKQRNLNYLIDDENFDFYEVDVRSEDFGLVVSNNGQIDVVIHLAARAGVRPSLEFPQSYVHHDVEATVNLFEVAKRFNIKNVIFGSSSSVYGNLPDLPYHEELKLTEPISPYAAAKLSCELFNHVFYSQYGINVTNLRFFTVYGPRQRPEMGIHKFVRLLSNDQKLQMYGDGSSSRDYTYIDDIVQGIVKAMENMGGYRTYNIGNSDTISLKDLILLIQKKLNIKGNIEEISMQPGDVNHTYADISKAKREIGYNPEVSISEGLDRFIEWYRQM